MKPTSGSTRRAMVLAGMALAATAAAPGTRPALAYDDQSTFSSILSFVGIAPGGNDEKIDYRERPKLVVPPDRSALPEPQAKGDMRPGAWPADQDVARRRDAAARAPAPQPGVNQNPALPPNELAKERGGSHAARTPGDSECLNSNQRECLLMKPEEATTGAKAATKTNALSAGEEPNREFLSEPPRGYRRPTKDVSKTRDPLQEKEDAANPLTYIRQQAGGVFGGGQ